MCCDDCGEWENFDTAHTCPHCGAELCSSCYWYHTSADDEDVGDWCAR